MYQQPNTGHGQGPPPNRGGFNQAPNQYGQQFAQQQPHAQQQYARAGYQGGFHQGGPPNRGAHHTNTYPPPKRQKGNPVITRYAPPPGYQAPPPGQPWQSSGQFRGQSQGFQPSFQQQPPSFQRPSGPPSFQNGWQPQQGQFGGGPMLQSPQTYTGQGQHLGSPQQQHGAHSYPQHYTQQQGYQGQQQHQSNGSFNTSNSPAGQSQQHGSWQGSPPSQNGYPAKNDNFGGSPHHGTPPRQGSGPHSGRGSVGSISSMPPPPSGNQHEYGPSAADVNMTDVQATAGADPDPNDPLNMKEHDWTFDPEGAIWPKATEIVDSSLSLGLIAWHPGTRMTRAIPSTYAAAEQFARIAPPVPIGLGDSVSTYFMTENHENAYENITSLAHWRKIKKDPVFASFPPEYDSLPVAEVKEWRNRADVIYDFSNDADEDGDVGLEGLGFGGPANGFVPQQQHSHHSQSHITASQAPNSQRVGDEKASHLDQSQEDILAKLGVEGPARPVYPTPGPAYGVQSADKSGPLSDAALAQHTSHGQASASEGGGPGIQSQADQQDSYPPVEDPIEQAIARAIAGTSSSPKHPGPPPTEPKPDEQSEVEPYDPWNPDHGMPIAQKPSPAPSNKTHSGSDFGQDATQAADSNGQNQTPPYVRMDEDTKPPMLRHESSASRKRSYDNFNDQEDGEHDHKRRQSNDGDRARRPSKGRQSSDDAYSRRW